ncbi:unnamed protein product [Phaeothamnion confervicola]
MDGSAADSGPDGGLNATEFAALLAGLGAVNAVHLLAGAAAVMTQNNAIVTAPAGVCEIDNSEDGRSSGGGGGSGEGGSKSGGLFRCEQPASSVLCVHSARPPMLLASDGTPIVTGGGSSGGSGSGGCADESGDDDVSGGERDEDDPANYFVADSGDDGDEVGGAWAWRRGAPVPSFDVEGLCANGTINETVALLWGQLSEAEDSVGRYRVTTWLFGVLAVASVCLNVQQSQRNAAATAAKGTSATAAAQAQASRSLINGGNNTGRDTSRRSRRRGSSRSGGSGYARVDANGGGSEEYAFEIDVPAPLMTPLPASSTGNLSGGNSGGGGTGLGRFVRGALPRRSSVGSRANGSIKEMEMSINPFVGGSGGSGFGGADEDGQWT